MSAGAGSARTSRQAACRSGRVGVVISRESASRETERKSGSDSNSRGAHGTGRGIKRTSSMPRRNSTLTLIFVFPSGQQLVPGNRLPAKRKENQDQIRIHALHMAPAAVSRAPLRCRDEIRL